MIEEVIALGDDLDPESQVDSKYYLTDEQMEKIEYMRVGKKIERTVANSYKYLYSEGSINRSTHLLYVNNRYRFLTPVEAQCLKMNINEDRVLYNSNQGVIK